MKFVKNEVIPQKCMYNPFTPQELFVSRKIEKDGTIYTQVRGVFKNLMAWDIVYFKSKNAVKSNIHLHGILHHLEDIDFKYNCEIDLEEDSFDKNHLAKFIYSDFIDQLLNLEDYDWIKQGWDKNITDKNIEMMTNLIEED